MNISFLATRIADQLSADCATQLGLRELVHNTAIAAVHEALKAPVTIYIAKRDIEFEGFDILGIFTNKDDADARCKEYVGPNDGPHGVNHRVEEFQLNT